MREKIKEYLNNINLNDYDLGGVEISDEDIDNIEEKVLKGKNIEVATNEVLYGIRDVLDENDNSMTEEMYEELKKRLFDNGVNAIEDFLGKELDYNTDEDMNEALDEIMDQMPEEELLEYYNKYCKKE